MKMRLLTRLTVIGLMATSAAITAQAETTAQTQNLFENAGKKQTSKDFKPAPVFMDRLRGISIRPGS